MLITGRVAANAEAVLQMKLLLQILLHPIAAPGRLNALARIDYVEQSGGFSGAPSP